MGLLNYTTKVPAAKTASEIQEILGTHGAKAVMVDFDNDGQAEALSFKIVRGDNDLGFKLPVHPDAVLKVLLQQHKSGLLRGHQAKPDKKQAANVAWRIIKDWVEAQMALLETQMVTMEEIFLPYLITGKDQTLYELMRGHDFMLPEGRG